MDTHSRGRPRPLGDLAPIDSITPWTAEHLDRSAPLPGELRIKIAAYLRGCPLYISWMEYTRDEIGDAFGVSGGSAIASDGEFYWRLDAADYVEVYGVAVPEEAIAYFAASGWQPPHTDRAEYLALYRRLEAQLI